MHSTIHLIDSTLHTTVVAQRLLSIYSHPTPHSVTYKFVIILGRLVVVSIVLIIIEILKAPEEPIEPVQL